MNDPIAIDYKDNAAPLKKVIFDRMDIGTIGGNNYYFKNVGGEAEVFVSMSWALLSTHSTVVRADGKQIELNNYGRYIFPKEALSMAGFEVILDDESCKESGLPVRFCFHCEQGINNE